VIETNKFGCFNGDGRKCQSPAKTAKYLVWSKLEGAIVDVEKVAEVIRLATATAFWKWRNDGKILLTKTKRLAVNQAERFPLHKMEKA
jgi:hypothetical protein